MTEAFLLCFLWLSLCSDHTHSHNSPPLKVHLLISQGFSSILKDGGGNILALAAHNWIAVIIHWESDAFQGRKID